MPDALTWQQGALVEPTSIGYNAVKTLGGVLPGDVVGVFGAGPIGLLTMLVAAANGASVVVIEPAQRRRALALELGARAAVDPTEAGFRDAVADLTSGRGFDGIVEASGSPAAMALALEVAAEHARLAYVGIKVGATTQATLGLIQSKALHIRGAVGSAGLWPSVIRLLASGTVDVGRIVTAAFPLTSALDALDAARDTARQIKVHIDVA
jgi:L-iditol 2-dehydrogenase